MPRVGFKPTSSQGEGGSSAYATLISYVFTIHLIATCFGHTTIFKQTYFSEFYSTDNGSVVFLVFEWASTVVGSVCGIILHYAHFSLNSDLERYQLANIPLVIKHAA
jgi:hypothetical protein